MILVNKAQQGGSGGRETSRYWVGYASLKPMQKNWVSRENQWPFFFSEFFSKSQKKCTIFLQNDQEVLKREKQN